MGLGLELVIGKENPVPSEKEKAPEKGIDLGCPSWGRKRAGVGKRSGAVAVLAWLLCPVPRWD